MTQDLVRAAPPLPTDTEVQTLYRIAEGLARSRSLGKVDKQEMTSDHIFTKVLIGRELGLSIAQSVAGGLYVFDGNVQMHYSTLLSAVQARGWDYEIEWLNEDGFKGERSEDTAGCSVKWISPNGDEKGPSRFTVADAKAARLWDKPGRGGGPGVWKTATRNMCLARCVSNGVKAYIPAATGGIPVYTDADDLEAVQRVPNLAEGNGDGSEPGWGMMPIPLVGEVEKVIRRAEKLGHGALANRASVQQIVSGMDEGEVRAWVAWRIAELDDLKASREPVVDGTAEEEPPVPEEAFTQATEEGDRWPGAPASVTDPANAKVVDLTQEYGEQRPEPVQMPSVQIHTDAPPAEEPKPRRRRRAAAAAEELKAEAPSVPFQKESVEVHSTPAPGTVRIPKDLAPDVQAIIQRAAALGREDIATLESMRADLHGKDYHGIVAWLNVKTHALDALEEERGENPEPQQGDLLGDAGEA